MRFYEKFFDRPLTRVDLDEMKTQFDIFKDEFDIQLQKCAPDPSWR